jgi:hypothetical protein
MTAREQWGGGEWQERCRRLLGAKYGENIQFVPDRVAGDGGLEAYRLDCRTVYQCYAPQDAFSTEAQTNAQKRKIGDDIYKLVSKPDETVQLLGQGYQISRWVLLTPEFDDKELVVYARAKSLKTRTTDPRPPWCGADFEIVVATDTDLFSVEMAQLFGPTDVISLDLPELSTQDAYASVDDGVAVKLTEKLRVCPTLQANETELTEFRGQILIDYVYGKQQLAVLEERYSAAFSAVEKRATATLRRLTQRLAAGSGDAADVDRLARELSDHLHADIPALARMTCDDLAQYYLADWWIICPLRFRGVA